MNKYLLIAVMLAAALLASGCARKQEEKKPGPPGAIITVVPAQSRTMQVVEQSVGEVDSATAPRIGAEVAGRIIRVNVEIGDPVQKSQVLAEIDPTDYSADAKRLKAQADTQEKLTERYRDLARKGFISPSALEGYESQNISTREQYSRAAKNLSRTRIVSPVDGHVDNRFVSEGDWIDLGKPVFQLSTNDKLRVRLPFPETAAQRIQVGQTVLLSTPAAPDKQVTGRIEQLRPMIGSASRAFDAIVEVSNPGGWKPGASVNGAVVLEEHAQTVAVPEISVVLRPAGKVVYVIDNNKAAQRIVRTGVTQNGLVEILQGLHAGETVAADGAGFLTDKAPVVVKTPDNAKGGKQ